MLGLPLLLLLAPLSVLTRPTSSPRSAPSIKSIYTVSDFGLENLAVRSNGHLLLTASNQSYLYDIDPSASGPNPTKLPPLSDVASVLGIAETSPDVFAVAAGNFSNFKAIPGSFSVWSVNMNTAEPTVKLITKIPEAEGLNGATALNGFSTGTVLIADSIAGGIWKVDVNTGAYSKIIENAALNPPTATSFGINGLRMSGNSLYFSNSGQGTIGRIPVNGDGSAAGAVEILANATSSSFKYDDLDIDSEGNVWVATHPGSINKVTPEGVQSNMTGFANPTSARFGKGATVETLYVVDIGNGGVVAVSNLI